MSERKDPWLVCRFTGTTNHVARNPETGEILFNLDEKTATTMVVECAERDPNQIYDVLPYPVGGLQLVLDQHHLNIGG